jgi:hypothetical protein
LAFYIPVAIGGLAMWTFVAAGMYHLTLLILGGAKLPFEATFRVVSYSTGGAALLLMAPVCGPIVANLIFLALVIIGLMRVQQIAGPKAGAVVLLPSFFCWGTLYFAFITLGVLILSQSGR